MLRPIGVALLTTTIGVALLTTTIALSGLIGCVPDTDAPGGPGQECRSDDDCIDDLICAQRLCRSADGAMVDDNATNDNRNNSDDDQSTNDDQNANDDDQSTNDDQNANGDDQGLNDDNQSANDDQNLNDDDQDPGDCCSSGCSDGEICHDCSCTSFNPQQCSYQDQPCETEGQITNGYVCSESDGDVDLRCYGLCTPSDSDPDSTCPDPGSSCHYEDPDQANGLCLSSCSIGEPCADDAMTCIYNASSSDEGLCQPQTGSAQVGEACQNFFDCKGDAVCAAGFCRHSCRPFDQSQTDCPEDYCLALNADIGVCAEDASVGNGQQCTAPFRTCGEDATGCFPENSNAPQPTNFVCRDMCRLQLGDQDCPADHSCQRHDQDNEIIGYCIPS